MPVGLSSCTRNSYSNSKQKAWGLKMGKIPPSCPRRRVLQTRACCWEDAWFLQTASVWKILRGHLHDRTLECPHPRNLSSGLPGGSGGVAWCRRENKDGSSFPADADSRGSCPVSDGWSRANMLSRKRGEGSKDKSIGAAVEQGPASSQNSGARAGLSVLPHVPGCGSH